MQPAQYYRISNGAISGEHSFSFQQTQPAHVLQPADVLPGVLVLKVCVFSKTQNISSMFKTLIHTQVTEAATHLSFRNASPCLSNRSSPLSVPSRSPCPDSQPEPFSDGADIQVANLDYRMSRKELQQILLDTFAKHGRVRNPVSPSLSFCSIYVYILLNLKIEYC